MPVLIIILIVFLASALVLPLKVTLLLLRPEKRTTEDIISSGIEDGSVNPEILAMNWKDFEVGGVNGGRVSGQILEGLCGDCIIFCHGVSGTRASALRMAEPFVDAGWGVVLFDFQGYGKSGRGVPSYGIREKQQLAAVILYVQASRPGSRIHLYGISMGAATVLQYLPDSDCILRAAADSSFATLKDQIYFRFSQAGLPWFLYPGLLVFSSIFIGLFGRFRVSSVKPAASASVSAAPLLLIHAKNDAVVPVDMCYTISGSRPEGAETLTFIAPSGGHTQAAVVERAGWLSAVNDFFGLE